MSKIRKYATRELKSDSFIRVGTNYNEIELYPRAKLHMFKNSIIHNYKAMEGETVYQELRAHTRTHEHLHIHRSKKVILPFIYPKEMPTVLAMYHNHLTIQYPSLSYFSN